MSQTCVVLLRPWDAGWDLELPSRASLAVPAHVASLLSCHDEMQGFKHTSPISFCSPQILARLCLPPPALGVLLGAGLVSPLAAAFGCLHLLGAPRVGYFERFPKKGLFLTGGLAAWRGRRCLGCPCPISLLLSRAVESSSRPCSVGWKM